MNYSRLVYVPNNQINDPLFAARSRLAPCSCSSMRNGTEAWLVARCHALYYWRNHLIRERSLSFSHSLSVAVLLYFVSSFRPCYLSVPADSRYPLFFLFLLFFVGIKKSARRYFFLVLRTSVREAKCSMTSCSFLFFVFVRFFVYIMFSVVLSFITFCFVTYPRPTLCCWSSFLLLFFFLRSRDAGWKESPGVHTGIAGKMDNEIFLRVRRYSR